MSDLFCKIEHTLDFSPRSIHVDLRATKKSCPLFSRCQSPRVGSSTYPELERTPSPHPVTIGDVAPAAAATEPRRISSSWMPLSPAGAYGSRREPVRLTVAELELRRKLAGDATVTRVA